MKENIENVKALLVCFIFTLAFFLGAHAGKPCEYYVEEYEAACLANYSR